MPVTNDLISHDYIMEPHKNPKQRGLESFWVGGQDASMCLEGSASQTPETEAPVDVTIGISSSDYSFVSFKIRFVINW